MGYLPLFAIYHIQLVMNLKERQHNVIEFDQNFIENEPKFTRDQRKVYESTINSINNGQGKIFFLSAPGGTGKTFLINLLLAKVRSTQKIVLASSGIAATLMDNGKTAHSTFKMPLDLTDEKNATCNISRNSSTAELLRCDFMVWDEYTMAHKGGICAVD